MESKTKYDSKKYYDKFKEVNSEKIHKKINCELCGGKYTYFNRSKHIKSKKHQFCLLSCKIKELEK